MIDLTTKYTYRITWSEEDGEYVGLCAEFPGLSWLADTQEAALAGIRDAVRQVVRDMQSTGEPIPQPLATRRYSGKFTVRIPPDVHKNSRYRLRNLGSASTVLSAPSCLNE